VRISLILNASRTDAEAVAGRLSEQCAAQAVELDVQIVEGGGLGEAARRAVDHGSSTVVAGGGDGTVSSVAGVLAGTETTLGVLPLGTLNHFARDLAIPASLDLAIATIMGGQVKRVDVGEVNNRVFINNSSVGLYPRLVWEREQRQKQGRRKWTAMTAAAWAVWRHYRRVSVSVQPGDRPPVLVRTPFVFVGNNPYQLAGLEFGSRAALDTGRLHVCMAPELSAAGVLGVLGATLAGRLVSFERFESLEVSDLTVGARRPRLGVALDGELVVLRTPLRYRIRPAALRVAVPHGTGLS
jgi:diacylglycerol kinase family enzyme